MAALEDNNASTLNFTVVDEVNIHSTTYIESIQCQLDNHINDMSAEWKASIPFCCHVILDHNNTTQAKPFISHRHMRLPGWTEVSRHSIEFLSHNLPTTYFQ
jgi:hypothetical protein